MITVIEQNTAERDEETRMLFEQIRPLLDKGYSYNSALQKIGRITTQKSYHSTGWFKELKKYGETKGYPYKKYSGKGHWKT